MGEVSSLLQPQADARNGCHRKRIECSAEGKGGRMAVSQRYWHTEPSGFLSCGVCVRHSPRATGRSTLAKSEAPLRFVSPTSPAEGGRLPAAAAKGTLSCHRSADWPNDILRHVSDLTYLQRSETIPSMTTTRLSVCHAAGRLGLRPTATIDSASVAGGIWRILRPKSAHCGGTISAGASQGTV